MLNVGFSELLLIAALALIFIGPKELPTALRHIFKFLRELQNFGDELRTQMHDIARESGLDDLKTSTIIDLEGKKQQAYDVKDLQKLGIMLPKTEDIKPIESEKHE